MTNAFKLVWMGTGLVITCSLVAIGINQIRSVRNVGSHSSWENGFMRYDGVGMDGRELANLLPTLVEETDVYVVDSTGTTIYPSTPVANAGIPGSPGYLDPANMYYGSLENGLTFTLSSLIAAETPDTAVDTGKLAFTNAFGIDPDATYEEIADWIEANNQHYENLIDFNESLFDSVDDDIANLVNDIAAMEQLIAQLEAQAGSGSSVDLDAIRAELAQAQQDLANANAELSALTQNITSLENDKVRWENLIAGIGNTAGIVQSQIDQLKDIVTGLQEDINEYDEEVSKAELENEALNRDLEDIREQISDTQDSLDRVNQSIADLRSEIAQAEQDRDTALGSFGSISSLQNAATSMESQITSIKNAFGW